MVEQIVASAGGTKSPIEGESWPGLSQQYKKRKIASGRPGKADLRFEGDLLGSLTWKETTDGIEIGWFGDQAGKADGHANLSGKSQIPTRRLIPGDGQSFNSKITRGIESIIAAALDEAGNGKD